jgi:hypothetical protein
MPVGLIGLLSLLAIRRSDALKGATAHRALIVSGLVTYLVTSLLFPVATRWGTFLHASGPLLVGLIVVGMIGLDGAVARLSAMRRWERPNPWLAPIVVLALAGSLGLFQVIFLGAQSRTAETRITAVSRALEAVPGFAAAPAAGDPPARSAALITDHPIWLAEVLRRPVIALPDEPIDALALLARDFGTSFVLVMDERGRYPGALTLPDAAGCFSHERLPVPHADAEAQLFVLDGDCDTR